MPVSICTKMRKRPPRRRVSDLTLSLSARLCTRPPWCEVSALPVNILTKIRCKISALPLSIFTMICMRPPKR